MIVAAGQVPAFLPQLVALLGGAAVVGYLSARGRVVPIVGFLLAGVLIGPHQLGLVAEQEVVDAAAEIGVILLLFTIGIEFSLERLASMARLITVAGATQVALTTAATAGLATAFGVPTGAAVFTGLVVSLSSTAIVLKVLSERRESASPTGRGAIGILLFQDLAVVAMVLVVPSLADAGAGVGPVARALAMAVLLVVGALVAARRLMPPVLDAVARTCSPEVFLLALVAICFGMALVSAAVGVSVSLGAFLAGLVVSESRHSTHAFGEVLPLQILFSATFFVSVGMLLDLGFLAREPLLVLGAIAATVAVKASTGAVAARVAGVAAPTAAAVGLLLAQVGEFSFVLDEIGRSEGLSVLDLGAEGSQVLIATTVVLMIATPLLRQAGTVAEGRLATRRRRTGPAVTTAGAPPADGSVLVLGYGDAARSLVGELRQLAVPFTIVTLDPDAAAEAEADGMAVVVGDYAKHHVLGELGIATAPVVVVADDHEERTLAVVEAARTLNPAVAIIARPVGELDVAELARAGADHVVTAERASAIGLAVALRAALAPGDGARTPVTGVVRFAPDRTSPCQHLAGIRPVQPSANGCEDCLRIGSTWVHLRICLGCGHVGCCDSSPHRHARSHAAADAHPVAASHEPADDWAYCFEDAVTIDRAPLDR